MADRTQELHDKLTQAIEDLSSSDAWKQYLLIGSKMHRYSFNNLMLISSQRPDATKVAGYNSWKKLGRQVQKGAKAIWIIGGYSPTENEQKKAEAEGRKARAVFKPVTVFDISDTTGPEIATYKPLEGDQGNAALWDELVGHVTGKGWSVHVEPTGTGKEGYSSPASKRVVVDSEQSPLQQLSVLAHEVAHVELGHTDDLAAYRTHRGVMELEAESTAWTVLQAAGVDTSDSSLIYALQWVRGDTSKVKETAEKVLKASKAIIDDCPSLSPPNWDQDLTPPTELAADVPTIERGLSL